jgi:phage shock protein C
MNDHLHRSRDDRMLAGVAGGLAELWDADPSLVRLVWALLIIFTGGIALVVYIVMALVVPEEDGELPYPPAQPATMTSPAVAPAQGSAPEGATPPAPAAVSEPPGAPSYWVSPADQRASRRAARRARRQRGDSAAPAVIGVFLVLIGAFFLAREWLPELDFDWFWPLLVIGLGVLLLVMAIGRRPNDPSTPS